MNIGAPSPKDFARDFMGGAVGPAKATYDYTDDEGNEVQVPYRSYVAISNSLKDAERWMVDEVLEPLYAAGAEWIFRLPYLVQIESTQENQFLIRTRIAVLDADKNEVVLDNVSAEGGLVHDLR